MRDIRALGLRGQTSRPIGAVLVALLCALAATHALAESYRGMVTSVVDGDTMIVEYVSEHISVRLWGVDAPARSDPLAAQSANSLAQFCLKKYATVNALGEDAYGRIMGIVTCGGVNVNEAQARRGLARVTVSQGLAARLLRTAEQTAMKKQRGLWSPAGKTLHAVRH